MIRWITQIDDQSEKRGYDMDANRYFSPCNGETVYCTTPDGRQGCGWTPAQALKSALSEERAKDRTMDIKNQVPNREFNVGDIVRIIDHDHDDQNGIHCVTGVKLNYFRFFRTHKWEYQLEDRFSSSGWFDEDRIEKTSPRTDDEAYYITGGNVPFRGMLTCQGCKKLIVSKLLVCPYCGFEIE